jgi:hypothetical protein
MSSSRTATKGGSLASSALSSYYGPSSFARMEGVGAVPVSGGKAKSKTGTKPKPKPKPKSKAKATKAKKGGNLLSEGISFLQTKISGGK